MVDAPTQDKRYAILTTPLGKDKLLLSRLDVVESISQPFEIRIDCLSPDPGLDFDKAIGQNCSVKLHTYYAERFFNGVMTEAEWIGQRATLHTYRVTLRPWFWLLNFASDCRIFKAKSVIDILKEVFSKRGFTDFEDKTSESYDPIEYCVQYRETDFAFASRLMEEFGIFYFFEHSDGGHKMILADSKSSLKMVDDLPVVEMNRQAQGAQADDQHLADWIIERRFRTGKMALNDYDYKKPNADLLAKAEGEASYKNGKLEVYDYPGRYEVKPNGDKFAKVRLQATQGMDNRRRATGVAPSLYPGGLVALDNHETDDENQEYLVVSATHSFQSEEFRSGGKGGGEPYYAGSYRFQPSKTPYRAPFTTPKPVVYGPQTAKVVGKQGEEIDVDDQGRIEVQFHWDREKTPSRRVRIAQTWAQKSWGTIVIPRIGQEVVVEFLEGDPDQPMVTGAVYNGVNPVPYGLPDNKTMTGIKSNSSKGGNGYNEFVFDDKKGSELIRMHGQKDHDVTILNTETWNIAKSFKTPRGEVSRDTTIENGDENYRIEKGDDTRYVKGDQTLTVDDNRHVKVKVNQTENIGVNQTVDVGSEIKITAGSKISLICGQSKIVMTPFDITIESMMINVKAELTYEQKALLTTVKADAILTLKGGVVFIN